MMNTRVTISILWIARMLSGLQGDTTRLSNPTVLQSMIAQTGDVIVTNGLLLIMSVIFVIPIFMIFLTLVLNYPVVRWTNFVAGIFFAMFDFVFLGLALFLWHSVGYEIVWSIAYLVFTVMIVWKSWNWPRQEKQY